MLAFDRAPVLEKLKHLEDDFITLSSGLKAGVPILPARDAEILPPQLHPDKKGLSTKEGQARLLHDLGSIELQAMELGLRTLAEFPEAPLGFREELVEITRSEGHHLKLCLEGIEKLGFYWGHWPVHCSLWAATSSEDSLLDRVLIVHRYLEGSGLDAGDNFLRRMKAVDPRVVMPILKLITEEEVGHVYFGSHWYREICKLQGIDPKKDFKERMWKIKSVVPKRIEKISTELRKKAGFTEDEIQVCNEIREAFLNGF